MLDKLGACFLGLLFVCAQLPLGLSFTIEIVHGTRHGRGGIIRHASRNEHKLPCLMETSRIDSDLQDGKRKDWHVWKTADRLERNGLTLSPESNYAPETNTTTQLIKEVIVILRQWGNEWAGRNEWQGILNKSSLLHEVEEAIVTLGFLVDHLKRMDADSEKIDPITIVDVCSGKGIFSLLASYIFRDNSQVTKIVMLDKAKIKWNHVDIVNESARKERRPAIETWQCNLHETDDVVKQLESLNTSLAMVGIHLCKTLSPTCIGIVNSLDPTICPFFILAPCCLPRAVLKRNTGKKSIIEIRQFETPAEKESRIVAKKLRDAAMTRKPQVRPISMGDQLGISSNNVLAPCWKCGMPGHVKADCPSTQTTGKPQLIKPPLMEIDVSNVLHSERPFDAYCTLLSSSIQRKHINIIDTGLTNERAQHQKGNWNNGRKSIYIVSS
jgi:hypothetical protein